jgi:hypothetical protein
MWTIQIKSKIICLTVATFCAAPCFAEVDDFANDGSSPAVETDSSTPLHQAPTRDIASLPAAPVNLPEEFKSISTDAIGSEPSLSIDPQDEAGSAQDISDAVGNIDTLELTNQVPKEATETSGDTSYRASSFGTPEPEATARPAVNKRSKKSRHLASTKKSKRVKTKKLAKSKLKKKKNLRLAKKAKNKKGAKDRRLARANKSHRTDIR